MSNRDHASAVTAELMSTLARLRRWAWKVLIVMVVVAVHLGVLRAVEVSAPTAVYLALYLVPSVLTLVCRRRARSRWWRFVVLMALVFVTQPGAAVATFFVAETWVLHRSWVAESDPADRSVLPRRLLPRRLLPRRLRPDRPPERTPTRPPGLVRGRRTSTTAAWARGLG